MRTKSKIRELKNRIKIDNFIYKIKIAILADELYHLGIFLELYLNSLMKDNLESRSARIIELIDELRNWNEDQFYFNRIGKQLFQDYYNKVLNTVEKIYEGAILNKEEAKKLKN
ncbi:hypothetical protein BBF96_07360 [Anoxybacter fermentans]|uniref:Uncharacterized protein n=1 Tax=Anoxybacter fermentans TaxID=1323375 RepID=A0A3Q9HQM0_9FIRM|nr:hypothetical protein [Anoxybacter fermentans]AZR73216.1 hypothetical protein BBF96_07360 [Anoxybacter fermentans]